MPKFRDAKGKLVWWSPVYFNGLSPLMAISLAHSGQNAGSTVGEINLGFLSDFIQPNQVGKESDAFIVDSNGRLLANSTLKHGIGTNLANLPQVAAMLQHSSMPVITGQDLDASSVLSGEAVVPERNWYVFFQQPLNTSLQPVYSLIYRTGWLMALGITLAALAGMAAARRLVTPIRALQDGARQLEASNFGYRIDVQTTDEIGELAEQFNRMAEQLRESYRRLEQKVAERTRDLAQSNSELKALEEIGRAVASSLDTRAVLATIVARAVELSHADSGGIYNYNSYRRVFELAESHGLDDAYRDAIRGISIELDESVLGISAKQQETISIPDLSSSPDYPLKDITLAAGFKSVLIVPLIRQVEILGALSTSALQRGRFCRKYGRVDADLC